MQDQTQRLWFIVSFLVVLRGRNISTFFLSSNEHLWVVHNKLFCHNLLKNIHLKKKKECMHFTFHFDSLSKWCLVSFIPPPPNIQCEMGSFLSHVYVQCEMESFLFPVYIRCEMGSFVFHIYIQCEMGSLLFPVYIQCEMGSRLFPIYIYIQCEMGSFLFPVYIQCEMGSFLFPVYIQCEMGSFLFPVYSV